MSQTELPPARPAVPWLRIAAIGAGAAIVIAVLVGIRIAQDDNAAERPSPVAQQSSAAAPASPAAKVVDAAQLATYWSDTYSGSDWYALASGPDWDGTWLSVSTKLHADADAKAPATAICAALSGYWLQSGRAFHSVRVLDQAGQVLVSRRTEGEQCSWRR